ncbi:MAG: hypothetical protein CM15mP89_0620 [Gammaproteobacteria bacterium]|nr:MAG: hypothetical protein CM15mP89_0620 [Gammaproteobacteria bacterium]
MSERNMNNDHAESDPAPCLTALPETLTAHTAIHADGPAFSHGAMALDSDRDQPIQIVADVAVRDELAGETGTKAMWS